MSPTTPPPTENRLPVSSGGREGALLADFDRLGPGESVEALVDDPRALLGLLRARRRGQFEWSPLAPEGSRWRVSVTRRTAAEGARREVTEALAWDHDRLEAIEASAFQARARGDMGAARESWALFARGLARHIRFEDEILFPEFEARSGMGPEAGPTAVMRQEHRRIEELLDAIGRAIGEPGSEADALRRELHLVLGDHNVKEEEILYPATDRLLSEVERDELVARIQDS
jgi:uncharacterized protein (DUF2249 family)